MMMYVYAKKETHINKIAWRAKRRKNPEVQ